MVKLVAMYRRPRDPQAWMAEFLTVTEPQLQQLPGLVRVELSQPEQVLAGGDRRGAPFLMLELYFPERGSLDRALRAPEAATIKAQLLEEGGRDVSVFVADVR